MRPREKNGGGGKAGNRDKGNETAEDEAASIIDACIYGGGVATDNNVRGRVATDITSTSGGVATLHAPDLETPAVGPSARVRPRMMNGGGGKAGNHDKEDPTSGGAATFRTPILKTPAASPSARVRPRVTNGGGGRAGNRSDVEDARPGMGICKGANGEVGSDNEAWADRPSPT